MYCYVYISLTIVLLLQRVSSRPNGAPMSACTTLRPNHTNALSFSGDNPDNPFVMNVGHLTNGQLNVTLTSTNNSHFRGFILQAREVGSQIPVGKFTQLQNETKTINCTNSEDTATHVNNTMKYNLTFTWTPPENFTGRIMFFSTVVVNFDQYWFNFTSEQITFPVSLVQTTMDTQSSSVTTQPPTVNMSLSVTTQLPMVNMSSSVNTQTSLAPITTTPPKATTLRAEIAIDRSFDNKLRDQTSKEFKDLANELEGQIEKVYERKNLSVQVTVTEFRAGSIIAEFTVTFQTNVADPLSVLSAAIEDNKLGDFTIVAGSLKRIDTTCPSESCDKNADCTEITNSIKCVCKPGFTGDGTQCTADEKDEGKKDDGIAWYIALITFLVGILVGIASVFAVMWLRRRLRKREDGSSTSPQEAASPGGQLERSQSTVYQELDLKKMNEGDNYQSLRANFRYARSNQAVDEKEGDYNELSEIRERFENYQSLNRV